MRGKLLIFIFSLFVFIAKISAQSDTVIYRGIINYGVLLESIELYPDSTFKLILDYEAPYWYYYGLYEWMGNELVLTSYLHPVSTVSESMTLYEAMLQMKWENMDPLEIRKYRIRDNYMRELDEGGNEIRSVKDEDLTIRFCWLKGLHYPLYYTISDIKY